MHRRQQQDGRAEDGGGAKCDQERASEEEERMALYELLFLQVVEGRVRDYVRRPYHDPRGVQDGGIQPRELHGDSEDGHRQGRREDRHPARFLPFFLRLLSTRFTGYQKKPITMRTPVATRAASAPTAPMPDPGPM